MQQTLHPKLETIRQELLDKTSESIRDNDFGGANQCLEALKQLPEVQMLFESHPEKSDSPDQ